MVAVNLSKVEVAQGDGTSQGLRLAVSPRRRQNSVEEDPGHRSSIQPKMASRPRGRGGSSARRRNAGLASVVKDDDSKPVLVADWDCVVVGAGVAGLAAAKNLQAEWPDKKIVVLEARDRVGGRVHTELVDGRLPLDLGAAWLHDLSSDNPLADFVRKSKVVTKISDYDYDAGTHYDMRPDWKEDSDESFEEPEQLPQAAAMPPEKVKQLAAAYEEFKNKLNENRERLFNNEEAEDAPLADLIAESKAQMGIDEGSKLSVWLDEMLYSAFEEVEGADTDELSGLFFDEVDVDVNNGVNLLFPSGAWEMFQP